MAQKVNSPSGQGEIFGRNQALSFLKKQLKANGIRVDLQEVFVKRRSYELLSVYFEPFTEDGSQKHYFKPKPDFSDLVPNASLLHSFTLLLPKPPSVVHIEVGEISMNEAAVHFGPAFVAG